MLELPMRDYVDMSDHIYELHRDPTNLDPQAEAAYQSRRYQRLKRLHDVHREVDV